MKTTAERKVTIDPLDAADAAHVAARMREIDRREIYYLSLLSPKTAVDLSVANSVASFCGKIDGEPTVLFGIARRSVLSSVGVPWMLATDRVNEVGMTVAVLSRPIYATMCDLFPRMENYILTDNARTVRWLRWLGFDMDAPAPYGPFGASFIRFGKG